MKILYVISSTSPFGGSSLSFQRLVSNLVSIPGIEILVVCPTRNGLFYDFQKAGIDVRVIPHRYHVYPPLCGLKNVLSFLPRLIVHFVINSLAQYRLQRLAIKYRPDIIHTNVGVVDIGYKVAKSLNIPHIYHLREYQDLDFGMKIMPSMRNFLLKLNAPNNYCICITNGVQTHFNMTSRNSIVIYDGIRNAETACFDKNKEKYFLFVGRINPSKGIERVIWAFAKFTASHATSGYELRIAGICESEMYGEQMKNLTIKLGIEKTVRFLGVRSDTDKLMQHATALIMASDFEGFGLVTAEAMFNGCLVVGRDVAGTKEQFDNGSKLTGKEIALRFESVDELCSRLSEVVKNGIETYFPMIQRGQDTVKRFYSIENNVARIYDLYLDILKRNNEQA